MTREELTKNILDQAKGLSLTGERLNALKRFEIVGLPHKKLENYKYTNVDAFFPTSLVSIMVTSIRIRLTCLTRLSLKSSLRRLIL